jgi:hypothetical protein
LFPLIFLLWNRAKKVNPEMTKDTLPGLLSYLPQDLGSKTMWSNGEELILAFTKSGQALIDIINQKSLSDSKLPRIQDITIAEVSPTF